MATRATCAALLVLLPHAESFIISSPALGLTDPSTRTVGAKNLRYSPLDSQPAHQRCVQTRNPLLDGTKRSRQCGPNMVMDPFVKDLFIGGLAGTVSNIIVFPVDLAKTKMQNAKDQTDKEKYGGFFTTVSSIVKEEGIHGLWSGSLPVLMGSAPESAIQLACHSWLVAFLLQGMSQEASSEAQLPLTLQIIAGGIAGASTLVATNPMEVLRIRAASSDQRCLITNVKSLGYQATWLRDIPFAGIYFPLYCNIKVFLAQMSSRSAPVDLDRWTTCQGDYVEATWLCELDTHSEKKSKYISKERWHPIRSLKIDRPVCFPGRAARRIIELTHNSSFDSKPYCQTGLSAGPRPGPGGRSGGHSLRFEKRTVLSSVPPPRQRRHAEFQGSVLALSRDGEAGSGAVSGNAIFRPVLHQRARADVPGHESHCKVSATYMWWCPIPVDDYASQERLWNQIVQNGANMASKITAQDQAVKQLADTCEKENASWTVLNEELGQLDSSMNAVDKVRKDMESICAELKKYDEALNGHLASKEEREMAKWKASIERDTQAFAEKRARDIDVLEKKLKVEQLRQMKLKKAEEDKLLRELEAKEKREAKLKAEAERKERQAKEEAERMIAKAEAEAKQAQAEAERLQTEAEKKAKLAKELTEKARSEAKKKSSEESAGKAEANNEPAAGQSEPSESKEEPAKAENAAEKTEAEAAENEKKE
eukprot:749086-Hanusia_phi.AAC.5